MATSRVRAGFFYTRTQPLGLDPSPGPDPFIKRIFFRGLDPPRRPHLGQPDLGKSVAQIVAKKKKKEEEEELKPKQSPNENLITV